MGLNSEDTVHPLLRHERAIATLEQQQTEHTKDNHGDLVKEVIDRLNNFQSDVFERIDRARVDQANFLQQTIEPLAKRLDDIESEIFPDGKDGEKESGENEDEENGDETPAPDVAVEMVTPDVQASPKPPEAQRQSRRAKRKARIAAKGQAK